LEKVATAATPTFNTTALTGIGFYTATTADPNYIRIDTLAVNATAIPEPGTLALVGIARGTLMFFRRRK
jgi:hypothetical protein